MPSTEVLSSVRSSVPRSEPSARAPSARTQAPPLSQRRQQLQRPPCR
ncbi:hypothetical protein CAter10_1058 [Collimonas arenae]|nr:hypothetical protein CAter10_1058 [Collimonas arenae]